MPEDVNPVPAPPDIAITPRVRVFDPQDNLATVPVSNYLELTKSEPGWTLAIPARTPDGKNAVVRGDKFKPLQDAGWRVRVEDPEKMSPVYELIKELQNKDSDAASRFIEPIANAIKGQALNEWNKSFTGKTWGDHLESTAKVLLGPAGPGLIPIVKGLWNLPTNLVKAAKVPGGAGAVSAAGIESLPIPFAPQIAAATQDATTGNFAGAMGNASLAGGMLLLQELGPKISEHITGPIGENVPEMLRSTAVKQARNIGAQREIVAKLHEISPELDPADLKLIRQAAGAEVRTTEELNDAEKLAEENERAADKRFEGILKSVDTKFGREVTQEQRVADIAELEQLATQVAGPRQMAPIQQAEHVMEVARGVKGATDEIEGPFHRLAHEEAQELGVETDLTPIARWLNDETATAMRTQAKLGVSSLRPNTVEGIFRMRNGILGAASDFVGELPADQQQAVVRTLEAMRPEEIPLTDERMVRELSRDAALQSTADRFGYTSVGQMLADTANETWVRQLHAPEIEAAADRISATETPQPGSPASPSAARSVPFSVADDAQRGLGAMIRAMEKAKAKNPNLAPDLRVLQEMQARLKAQIQRSIEPHPQLNQIYNRAREISFEQHETIDREYIQEFFGNPRYRLAAEDLVKHLMEPGTERLQSALLQALEVGPAARRGLDYLSSLRPEEAARVAEHIRELSEPSAAAKAGLRRMVVDRAIQKGTKPSGVKGVPAPKLDYNAMVKFLDPAEHPGAKILLGDQYEPLMRTLREKADAALRVTNPVLEEFIQKEAAKSEVGTHNPARGAEAAMQEMAESEFISKLRSDKDFWVAVKRNAPPEVQRIIARSVIADDIRGAMERGYPGSADAVMDFEKFGKNLEKDAMLISDFSGDSAPALQMQGLGRAINRASQAASTGLIGKQYFWGAPKTGLPVAPRMTAGVRPGIFKVGPKQIGAEVSFPSPPIELSKTLEPPIELPEIPPALDEVIFRASQDPELAAMMKRALKVQPWQPGFGTQALKYYLAFQHPNEKQGKVLDERTATDILRQAGGKIDVAVPLAQSLGYVR